MKSEWRVTANPVGGRMLYAAYRLRDRNAVDHSGNREYYGDYVEDRKEVEALVDRLNQEEGR